MIGLLGVRQIATAMAATAGAAVLVCCAPSSSAQESRVPASSAPDIPARLSRQVAPTPSTYWRPPDLRDYTRVLRSTEAPVIDPDKRYELPELIGLAQRVNPETRVAWEAARGAALAVGLVESEYFPVLAMSALGGYKSVGVPIPKNLVSDGFFRFDLAQAVPALNLRWLLLDFGRRGSARDAAKERLLAANLGFNRKHQQIAFAVQSAFYGLTSIRARIAVAQSSLDAARAVQDAAERRLQSGLGTRPELALARQQTAQAIFEVEEVVDKERDAQVTLAESIGIPPTTPIFRRCLHRPRSRISSRRRSITRSGSDPTSSLGSPPYARPRPRSDGPAPPTGRLSHWSRMSGPSWAARGSPPTGSPPGGSGRPNRAMASGWPSSGRSSTAARAGAGWSWPNRRVAPPRTRSLPRATARSAKSGRRTPTSSWPSGASTSPRRWSRRHSCRTRIPSGRIVWGSARSPTSSPPGAS